MRIQLSIAAMALVSLTFAGGTFSSGFGSGTTGPGKVYSIPNGTPLRQYDIHAGKGGVSAQSGPAVLYNNTTTYTGYYAPGSTFPAVCDDLHMVSGGNVNGYSFIYFDPAGGNTALTAVEVGIFANTPADPDPHTQTLLYDQYLTGLPGDGLWQVNVDLSSTPFAAPADLWMGIAFGAHSDSSEAGWVTYGPPTVGSSHDMFYEFVSGTSYGPGVSPVYNYGAAVYATPEPGTVAAVLTGLVGLVGLRRRTRA